MSALFDDGRDENNRNKSRGREQKKKGGKKVVVVVGGWLDVELWSYNNNHGRESWPCELRR